jgi:hypothetical protein
MVKPKHLPNKDALVRLWCHEGARVFKDRYIYEYIYVYVYTFIYMCLDLYIYTCINVYIYINLYVYIYRLVNEEDREWFDDATIQVIYYWVVLLFLYPLLFVY